MKKIEAIIRKTKFEKVGDGKIFISTIDESIQAH